MQTTLLKTRIIEEINLIPEDKLEQIYQMIFMFRLGLERLRELTHQHSKSQVVETQALRELESAYLTMTPEERQQEIALAEEGLQGQPSIVEMFPAINLRCDTLMS